MELLVYFELFMFLGGVLIVLVECLSCVLKYTKKIIGGIVWIATAEWLFKIFPNGGTAVILRTLFSGSLLLVAAALMYKMYHVFYTEDNFDVVKFVASNWLKFCGMYAAVYASFYTRFVSQWTYLSNLYNQIKNADLDLGKSCCMNNNPSQCGRTCNCLAKNKLDGWMAGFIEDAETLHMETKPIFSTVIYIWLEKNPKIADIYKKSHAKLIMNQQKADDHYNKLLKRIEQSLKNA